MRHNRWTQEDDHHEHGYGYTREELAKELGVFRPTQKGTGHVSDQSQTRAAAVAAATHRYAFA